MTSRPAVIPVGAWPARMPADLAAGYCGKKPSRRFSPGSDASILARSSMRGVDGYGYAEI